MRNLYWFLLFMAGLAIYGLVNRWWDNFTTPEFETLLLQLPAEDIRQITVRGGEGEKYPLLLTHTEQGWVASRRNANLPARQETVDRLLQELQQLRSYRLMAGNAAARRTIGWSEDNVVQLDLRTADGEEETFFFHPLPRPDSNAMITALARIGQQPEVYGVGPLRYSSIPRQLSDLRDPLFLQVPDNRRLVRITDRGRDTSLHYVLQSAATPADSLLPPVADSILASYWKRLQRPRNGRRFVNDFDEIDNDRFLLRQLRFYLDDGDSLILSGFRDSLRPHPIIVHSSQFPWQWVAGDTLGQWRDLFVHFPLPHPDSVRSTRFRERPAPARPAGR